MAVDKEHISFVEFLPIGLFGGILGMTGLTFSWKLAEKEWGINPMVGNALSVLTVTLFLALIFAYGLKWLKYPSTVTKEFSHPVSIYFFTTFIVSLLLVPGILLHYNSWLALLMWSAGVLLMFVFAIYLFRRLLSQPQEPGNLAPPLLLPVVGLLDVPIVGTQLPVAGVEEVCLLCFGLGLVLSIITIPLVISRLLLQPSLPVALQPTLMVLLLPFAIAYSDYNSLSGTSGIFGNALYSASLFLFFVTAGKMLLLARCCPFRVGWWAVSFPLSAITIASFRYAFSQHHEQYFIIPVALLFLLTLTIAFLLFQTVSRILQRRLLLADPLAEEQTNRTAGPIPNTSIPKEIK